MAKKIIEINHTPFIQPIQYSDSKNGLTSDTTFKFTTTDKTYVNFQPVNTGDITHNSYYVKDGDDLKFFTVYYDGNTYAVKKKITMTILDYASHHSIYDDVVLNDGSPIQPSAFYLQSTGNARVGRDALYAGTDKADKFTIAGGGSKTFDYKGNDSYNVAPWDNATSTSRITDYTGNDKYSISVLPKTTIETINYGGETNLAITDFSGNDVYTAKDPLKKPAENGISATISDYNGNDKYNFNSAQSIVVYEDGKGKDAYNITNTNDAKVYDWGGNDTYNVANSKIEIRENMSASSSSQKGTTGNETYNLNSLIAGSKVYDLMGNDKYNINYAYGKGTTSNQAITITDTTGKDTYKIAGTTYADISDLGGNDNYTFTESDNITLLDKLNSSNTGDKDSYTLKTVSNSDFTDESGDDTYKIDSSLSNTIVDEAGTDKYTVTNSTNTTIQDNDTSSVKKGEGNDTFVVKDSINTSLQSGYGDDKFTISDDSVRTIILDNYGNETYTAQDAALLKITDYIGDDSYKLTDVDNYNVQIAGTQTAEGALDYNIKDSDGSDKYDIKNSRAIHIYDEASSADKKNTFNVTSSSDIKIYSAKSSAGTSEDTYNLNSNTSVTVEDYGASSDTYNLTSNLIATIDDKGTSSSDTYNLKSVKIATLTDRGTDNDTYNLDKITGKTTITDFGGENDSLIIKGAKANNIVFMADAGTDLGNLFAYDKKNGGFIKIAAYYNYSDEEGGYGGEDHERHLTGYDVGQIETVKLGSSKADIKAAGDMDLLQESVTNFLTSEAAKGYTTIETALSSGDSDVINGLIACFNPQA